MTELTITGAAAETHVLPPDLALRDMDAAMATISRCREDASMYRQSGFHVYADWLLHNSRKAEGWLLKAAKAYPGRVDLSGRRCL